MSYASFTKIVPDLLKSAPQKLIQPTGIAVIASVGIHALVGVSLPYWSNSSQKKSQPVRNVKLLQLTPTEQSRLPQVPPASVPPTANQLPPLSSLPSTGSSLGSSSLPPLPSKDSSLFNLPPITPLPPLGKIPSLSQSSRQPIDLNKLTISNSPPRKDLSTPKQSISSSSPLPKVPNNPLSKVPSSQQLPSFNISELPPAPSTPWPAPGKELSQLPRVNPTNPAIVNPNLDGMVPQLSMPPSTLPERPLPPSPSTNLPIDRYPIPPSGAAMTQIPPSGEPLLQMPPSGEPLLQTPQATALAPSPSQRNVTDNSSSSDRNNLAFINKLGDWSKRHQTNDPKRLDISGNYPERVGAVGGPNSGIVSVAVKVEPNGKIDSNTLEVIGSNVSNDVFDREAEAAVRRHQFPATGKVEYYSVNVQFNNSNTSTLKSPTQLQPPVALPNSAGLLNLPKLSNPTTAPRSTITGTPAQNLMEKLRRNLTNTSPSSPTDKKPESTTSTSRSNTTDKKPESTTSTSRSNTTDKKPESTTNTSPSSPTDKKPESTTSTSRSNTTDKKPESTTNTSRSNTTDTSAQNLINKLRRSLSDTPPSSTKDTPRSNTTDTTPVSPTKE